jgi:hypothetical protein
MHSILHTAIWFGKHCMHIALVVVPCVVYAQSPAVFNFQNATEVSTLPEQLPASNAAPASMQKRYYIDPTTQLFDAAGLKEAYMQMGSLRSFYAGSHNAPALWEQTRNTLFADPMASAAKCDDVAQTLLMEQKPNAKTDYKAKLTGLMGESLYGDLRFCLSYMGMQYSDWELWQAYAADRTALVNEVKSINGISNRLMALILATDIKYTLCSQQNPNVACLMPLVPTNNDNR